MKRFKDYVKIMDENEGDVVVDRDSDADLGPREPASIDKAVDIAVRKGYKKKLIGFLRSLGDEEIDKALGDVDKGLGDVTGSNHKDRQVPEDEVVPSSVDKDSDIQ
jgi:hypothetical protein